MDDCAATVRAEVEPALLRPGLCLGLIVPKRHAKRATTRNLVRRQVREAVRLQATQLVAGDWVIRLRAPIDRQRFPSARSDALAQALRAEIAQLLGDAARRVSRQAASAQPVVAGS